MKYFSVCSGIEAATVAWQNWQPVGFSEIEKFPCQVLAHHYPAVQNLGDMTKYKEWNIEQPDLLVGGTPCQSFSVAGLRKGMDDPRGNLALVYCGILDHFRPRWFVWENVPGVLSSNGGRDFGSFLGALAQLGYGFAYRVLDAQFFGVAQRRRRVFVVGHLGDWRPAAAVLFERESLRRDSAPSREKGEAAAASAASSVDENGIQRTVGTLCADTHPGAYSGQDAYTGRLVPQIVGALTAKGPEAMGAPEVDGQHYIPISCYGIPGNWIGRKPENGGNAVEPMHNVAPCLTGTDKHGVSANMAVRRLTPVECERLQGFPDNYTNIKDNCPDGPRYKALGNSMAVPVMRWIGQRIDKANKL
jgi:DNA (cytosine-5)-methyltransferase 1